MRIIKLGHSCLLIEEQGVRILVDPGVWNDVPNDLNEIDVLLITHKHPDHFDLEKIKHLLTNNPTLKIYTNLAVKQILMGNNINSEVLEDGQGTEVSGINIQAFGRLHAEIYPGIPVDQNTGFLIADRLFHPGDQFIPLDSGVEILALPISGPWLTLRETIDYAKSLKPQVCFPIHDGMLKQFGSIYNVTAEVLKSSNIEFRDLTQNPTLEV